MSYKLEKTMRIVDELVGFCCRRGCKDLCINYNTINPKETVVTIVAKNTVFSEDDISLLNSSLSQNRQREMEECYWLITGDDSFGDELSLIGVMVDDCEITYIDNALKIVVHREENN